MEILSETACFGGTQGVYRHPARSTNCAMTFGLFLPPAARRGPVPLLWYLSGLTCTHENAMTKSGAQAHASRHGLALVFPDTSPRGEDVADDPAFDLGQGAGFYVNAQQAPWAAHYQMWDYICVELTKVLLANFPLDEARQAITGHSMGGHGALTMAMRLPGRFASVSAFAPICNPSASDWGRKQFTAYLGSDDDAWAAHDASRLMRTEGFRGRVLIDQGSEDQFLELLRPETLAEAMIARRQPGSFRMHAQYDHSYFFVSSFMADHVAFHADALSA